MNLHASQVRQILAGDKTSHRLPATSARYSPGQSVPVRVHKPSNAQRDLRCRVIVHDTTTVVLGTISFKQARAEGHRTSDQFRCWWVRHHDRAWIDQLTEDQGELEPEALLERFELKHAHRPVLAVAFKLDISHRPRLLVPLGRTGGDELGYTEAPGKALRDEPEAVEAEYLKRFADEAEQDANQRTMERANGYEWETRLRAAEAAGVDVTRERLAIERMVGRASRKMNQRKAA
jgi:hypothetical protein